MTELLDEVVEAHGGLQRWRELESVTARLRQDGVLWALKGHDGLLADCFVTARLHEQWASHRPFGAPDRRSLWTPPGRVAIETTGGDVVEELEQPRSSFAGHTVETPWTQPQLAYFVGCAMWTYLTQPFTFTWPGFATQELDPWQEEGAEWRRLRVVWPGSLATHSTVQTIYVGDDGLIKRHDYDVEISGGSRGAHYMSEYVNVGGISLPSVHRIFPRAEDESALSEPLLVSIEISEITFV